MSQTGSRKGDRAAAAAWRQEVERCLAAAGFSRGPRRMAEAPPPQFEGETGRRLRPVLERLGTVFAAFGVYLSSRPDLLPVADCFELARTREDAEPLPAALVWAMAGQETGVAPEEMFESFAEVPSRCRLTTQEHGAALRDGRAVLVRVVRPDLPERLARDLDLLPLLGPALARGGRPFPFDAAIADFVLALEAQCDLPGEADALRSLAVDAPRGAVLRVPRVLAVTPRLLCREFLDGKPVMDLVPAAEQDLWAPSGYDLGDLARRLCLAWLSQALVLGTFPVELDPADAVVFADGSLGLGGGVFAGLPAAARASVRDYLDAVAAGDPGQACTLLLREMEPGKGASPQAEAELRQAFRQAVPFRDAGWGAVRNGQGLAAEIFIQWRLAAERGYRAPAHLLAFYRGLFALSTAARRLAPQRDCLLDAIENLRLFTAFEQLGRLGNPSRLRQGMEAYAGLFFDLPKALDEVLRGSSGEGGPRIRIQLATPPGAARGGDKTTPAVVLVVALAAVALVAHRLAAAAPPVGTWAETAGAVVFMVLGALLLRVVSRQGS